MNLRNESLGAQPGDECDRSDERCSGRPRELVIYTRNVDGGQVEVTVEDSGVGLDATTITRIFQPFYTTKSTGMGMGLSICRSIVQNHGGRIWATANDGNGTSFHFSLPQYYGDEQNGEIRLDATG